MTTTPLTVSPWRGGFFLARILVLLLGFSGLWIVLAYSRSSGSLLECQILALTGHECPACGITRGLSALVHGRFQEAWTIYPFAFPVAFGTAFAMIGSVLPVASWRRMMAVRWFPWLMGLGAGLTGFGIVVLWLFRSVVSC